MCMNLADTMCGVNLGIVLYLGTEDKFMVKI